MPPNPSFLAAFCGRQLDSAAIAAITAANPARGFSRRLFLRVFWEKPAPREIATHND
jgi:hypothetical protein